MESKEYDIALSLKKMSFIQQIVSERSLDTLRVWMDMYDEARDVAAMSSDEDELKDEHAKKLEAWKRWVNNHK